MSKSRVSCLNPTNMMSPEATSLDPSSSVGILDNGYWNAFYKVGKTSIKPSLFAQYCQKQLFDNKQLTIVEAGCGNGRDSFYFAELGHKVLALDQSDEAIKHNQNIGKNFKYPPKFLAKDFVSHINTFYEQLDAVYSRFTMHAISLQQQVAFLNGCYNALKTGGRLCIEVRTINDGLFGVGKSLGDNAFYSDHYRRFVDPNKLLTELELSRWKIELFDEATGYAPYQNEDPPILRIVLEK